MEEATSTTAAAMRGLEVAAVWLERDGEAELGAIFKV